MIQEICVGVAVGLSSEIAPSSVYNRLSDSTFPFHFHASETEIAATPVLLPGASQGPGSLVGCRLWGRTESEPTEAT